MKTLASMILLLGTATFAFAFTAVNEVPEISGSTATTAVALLSGALLLIRARRKE